MNKAALSTTGWGLDMKGLKTIKNEFTAWVKELNEKGRQRFYRGLADASWKLDSSARRRVKINTAEDTYIKDLIKDARKEGFGCQDVRSFPSYLQNRRVL